MMNVTRPLVLLCTFLLFSSCHPRSCLLEPKISYIPQKRQFETLPSAFEDLSFEELEKEWGREMKIAITFARELDLYRAITGFKRALILMPPPDQVERRQQVKFYIIQCYYLGKKYQEAVESFEHSQLPSVSTSFPAFRELLLILYDSYEKIHQPEKAQAIMSLMEKGDPETALDLKLFSAIDDGNLTLISHRYCGKVVQPVASDWSEFSEENVCKHCRGELLGQDDATDAQISPVICEKCGLKCVTSLAFNHSQCEDVANFVDKYCYCSKSVRTAQTLNALLPGAGYYYVGQKRSALTSFVLNTAFIAAAYHFFENGNWGAGLITTSLEFGWYFGGINGAGLAAKEYNEYIYQEYGKELMLQKGLFPVLMLQTSF